jgi:hypothetical protein
VRDESMVNIPDGLEAVGPPNLLLEHLKDAE